MNIKVVLICLLVMSFSCCFAQAKFLNKGEWSNGIHVGYTSLENGSAVGFGYTASLNHRFDLDLGVLFPNANSSQDDIILSPSLTYFLSKGSENIPLQFSFTTGLSLNTESGRKNALLLGGSLYYTFESGSAILMPEMGLAVLKPFENFDRNESATYVGLNIKFDKESIFYLFPNVAFGNDQTSYGLTLGLQWR